MTRLSGIRGLLLDLDGVLVLQGRALPGAQEALRELDRRDLPYHVVTNTSLFSRESLASWGRSVGLDVPAERITSALSASAAYTAHAFADQALYVIASADARREFEGQRLLSHGEADAPDAEAAAVVIGDAPEEATYDNLNRAFRLIRRGARLIGMHKNRWWLTPAGPTLDSGAFVAGLEFAAGVRGMILGKPSPAFFREAADEILAEVRRAAPPNLPRPHRANVLMVGDDLWTDVLAAQRLGLRGAFVLSGKHGRAELEQAARQPRGGGRPDLVAASLAEVIEALD
ncbi:MAG: HAD-IIA family hydrolase [Chloroflexi bacterium]|nr:MAG: HAD-IIA family hydrolase [Chloroflexota bacterium]